MSYADIDRRLRRIEAGRTETAPVFVMADRPLKPGEAAEALANWRDWVADGRASVGNGALWIGSTTLTMEEWEARFCTEH